ncbi:GH92 family glycosyl hydrolase [Paraflavitalea sp. CAU 1676]|uniref:GH92 family glycosyl hydrolase n=1 Tax=Paraflavitalea sp. CAU 1676 TaxID=3032598 RepID=UPI0023DC81B3|nr:GH92 family glycosyl hydrolase [Paraflavitalea sp. CAU 1676]MDF2192401.1 GH92 family glycosyl hydrolase [Paraflavitalea sp. CAU 1676]
MMKYKSTIRKTIFGILFISAIGQAMAQSYTQYVYPLIGSGGHGHVFVGASVPFGAIQPGPNNFYKGWDWCSGYNYGDSVLIGFSQTHLSGTGIGDLADVLMMPFTGAIKTDKGKEKEPGSGYASRYRHSTEKVRPGYYTVQLDDYNVKVELTATEHVAFHQYHFPAGSNGHVIIDLKEGINDQTTDSYIRKIDEYTLVGRRFSKGWAKDQWLYFAIRSAIPLKQFSVYDNAQLLQSDSATGKAIKGLISFDKAPTTLQLKVSISPVSAENALANITAELPHWNFQQVVKQADSKWNSELARIQIQTNSLRDRKIFYTALFHTMINPSLFNDHDGAYRGADKKVYTKPAFQNYSVFSLWDTYRATNPLFTITHPHRVSDMVNSMIAIHQQQGRLPIWHLMGNETGTMVGISSLQVIAEAYLKGIRGYDVDKMYEAIRATAMSDSLGMKYVKNLEAIPSDKSSRAVARALEYCISDASIALLAKALNKQDDYEYFSKRSQNYRLYYDPAFQFFKGRLSDGTWKPAFDAVKSYKPWADDYAEGNAWQYLWLAPHDVDGLQQLLGGRETFIKRLDTFFTLVPPHDPNALVDLTGLMGQYAHGNEPSHHITYLYTMVGQPHKTAEKVRYIMKEMYHDQPDGIIGNEDCGQMSAWYIFSSLGFYPVYPASGKYVFGSPLFNKATISLPGGKKFSVETSNNTPENIYIQSITWNGKPYTHTWFQHSDLLKGGVLKIIMGNKPSTQWGQ